MKAAISQLIWNLFVNTIGRSAIVSNNLRYILFRIAGMRTKSSNIRSGCTFRGKSVFIGKNVLINHNVFIDAWEKVIIGDNVSIAFGVMICTSSHQIGDGNQRAGQSIRKPVTIEDGCWIGANATILPGVYIGKGCIIAAGSIVLNNCEENCLYAGIPAKRVKFLNNISKYD